MQCIHVVASIVAAFTKPAFNGGSETQLFECSSMIEIHNGII